MQDWDHVRFFLAAARAGSLNAAAKVLGTSQPTVGRQIASLEKALHATLFDRRRDGLTLTEAGRALWHHALTMEESALALGRAVAGQDDSLAGTVRISATEGLCALWLTPLLQRLGSAYPRLTLEVVLDGNVADLLRREAEIAVRLTRPIVPDLVARRVGSLAFRLFAAPDYLVRHGTPQALSDLPEHRFVTLSLRQSVIDETWQDLLDAGVMASYRTNSSLAQIAATRAGFGLGLLPAYTAKFFPDLVPVLGSMLWHTREIWLVAHPEVRRGARIRLVFDEIVRLFQEDADLLSGTATVDFQI